MDARVGGEVGEIAPEEGRDAEPGPPSGASGDGRRAPGGPRGIAARRGRARISSKRPRGTGPAAGGALRILAFRAHRTSLGPRSSAPDRARPRTLFGTAAIKLARRAFDRALHAVAPRLLGGRDEGRPHDDPVGEAPRPPGPQLAASRSRSRWRRGSPPAARRARRTVAAQIRGKAGAGAGRAGARDDIEEPRGERVRPRSCATAARSAKRERPCRGRATGTSRWKPSASSGGRSVTRTPSKPACARLRGAARDARADSSGLRYEKRTSASRVSLADPARHLEDVRRASSRPRARSSRGALQDGAVGDRIGEGNAELQHVGARPVERARQRDGRVGARGRRRSGTR